MADASQSARGKHSSADNCNRNLRLVCIGNRWMEMPGITSRNGTRSLVSLSSARHMCQGSDV